LDVWAFGRHPGGPSRFAVRDRGADVALRRHLGWVAPAGAAFATLAAAAGAAFGDRPTVFGALVLFVAVAIWPLVYRRLATRILVRLAAASAERQALRAELDLARRTKAEFRDLAYHDDLTGLPNRSLLYDRLGLAIAHSYRQESYLALLFLDLDDFKTVNDSFGHDSGDRLLVELATRVCGSVRAGDTVARFGGDEFVVLLDSVSGAEDAARVAAKVLDAVRAPFRLAGHEVSIAASVGVSVYPLDGTSPDELVKSADTAMYREKRRAQAPDRARSSPHRAVGPRRGDDPHRSGARTGGLAARPLPPAV
jgi:diguanylate cyclase (GGDEF)-like protein